MEWKVRSLDPRLVRRQDVAKGEGLLPQFSVLKICVKLWRRGEETNVTQTYHRQWSGGEVPSRRGLWVIEKFCNFLEKVAILMPFG